MPESPRLVTAGTIDGGATAIDVDVTVLGSAVPVAVTLSTDYAMLQPPGYPLRPSFTGAASAEYPGQVATSGTTIMVLDCEAAALVNAGAAAYAA